MKREMFVAAALLPIFVWLNPAAQAEPADAAFSARLMQEGIEAYSQAGARGDQQAADALLDEDVLFAGGDGSVQHDDKRDRDDPVAATLKAQTLALRRAASMSDLGTTRRYFLPDLLAIDENGKVMEGEAAYRPASDLPLPGTPVEDSISDWVVHHDGKTAVAAYVDQRSVRYGGQTLRFRSLVIDTWVAQRDGWKLFATHATPLFDDPATANAAGALDAYTGDYAIGNGAGVRISRDGETLLSSVNGAKPTPYVQEWPDVFYASGMAPGSPRAHLYFRRDAAGHVTGYASSSGLTLERIEAPPPGVATQGVESTVLPAAHLVVHRLGDVAVATFIHERVTHYYGQTLHTQYRSTETWVKRGETWKMLTLQSRALEHEMPARDAGKDVLGDYAGTYAAGAGLAGRVALHEGVLRLHVAGPTSFSLRPVVRDDFASADSPGATYLFQRNREGRVTGFVLRRLGRDLLFVKLPA